MLTVRFVFQFYFSSPLFALEFALSIGVLIGVGSMGVYLARRFKQILQRALGERVPRHIARSQTVSLYLNSILLVIGLLLFFGLLAGNVYFTGTVLNGWTSVFVPTCGLVILSGYTTVFIARKRREKALRLERAVIGGEKQRVRSRPLPVPKEAREEEQPGEGANDH